MRNINGLLQSDMACETTVLLSIDWNRNGSLTWYADKTLPPALGRIAEIGEIDDSLSYNNSRNLSVSVTLDDSDSTIKTKLNTTDIQKLSCSIYMTVEKPGDTTDPFNNKFLLFAGQINSPFTWSEGDRTVKFSVVSVIEDVEAGFSPEDSQIPYVTPEQIDKPWPMVFGHVVHVPAVKTHGGVTGTLNTPLCIPDFRLEYKLNLLANAFTGEIMIRNFYHKVITGIDQFLGTCTRNIFVPPGFPSLFDPNGSVNKAKVLFYEYERICVLQLNLTTTFWGLQNQIAELKKQIKAAKTSSARAKLVSQVQDLQKQVRTLLGDAENKTAESTEFQGKINTMLANISYYKEWLKSRVKICLQLLQVKKTCQEKMIECTTFMKRWKTEYILVKSEQCKQSWCNTQTLTILNSEHFPTGEIQLEINGLIWPGSFGQDESRNNTNTFTTIGPRNLYGTIPLAPWQPDTDNCGTESEILSYNVFYVADASVQLEGKYIRVRSSRDESPTVRHILKVESQVGNKCHFSLRDYTNTQGGQILQTPVPIVYPGSTNILTGQGTAREQLVGLEGYVKNQISAIMKQNAPQRNNEDSQLWVEISKVWPWLDYSVPLITYPDPKTCYTILGEEIIAIEAVAAFPVADWFNYEYPLEEMDDSYSWRADNGASVHLANDAEEVWICNIMHSTIKAVYAYKTDFYTKKRVLTQVPTRLYTKNEWLEVKPSSHTDSSPFTATALYLKRNLSSIINEGWEDQLYVTLNSSVGPNITDIITYLVQTYTTCSVDVSSFSYVNAKQTLYPANFAILTRKNVKSLIGEIAWQARCCAYESNGVYHIKYLAEEPTSVATLDLSTIESTSLITTNTQTDSIITCMDVTWRQDYLPESTQYKIKLRYNVNKYGLHRQQFDWYIYNDQSLVMKSATFWMIRYANTWRHVQCNTFLHNIGLESLDCVTVNTAFTGNVKGIVEQCTIDTATDSVKLDVWLPIRVGEMTQYPYAWPASLPSGSWFPTALDIEYGYAGGNSIASRVGGI